jgi:hypothetical protein
MWPWPKPGPVAEAGRLRAEPGRAGELLDGLLALARARHGVLPGRAGLLLGAVTAGESSRSVRSHSRRPPGEIGDGGLVAFSRQSTPHGRVRMG